MSRAGTRWLAAIGAALLLTACTTTVDHAVPTRASAADTDTGAALGSAAASPPISAHAPTSIAPAGSGAGASTTTPPVLPWPPPSDTPLPQGQALQAAVQRIAAVAAAAGMRGVTAAVLTPQGSWAGAVGVDGDGVPLAPEAMMSIAEVTNTVTAAEVMFLAKDGRIDLDAPLSNYLNHPLLGGREPTVRQLLSHTSGLPDYDTHDLMTALRADPTRSWTADQALSYAASVPPAGPPDTLSMSDYLLLGLLIEKITGLGYAAAVQRDLLAGNGDDRIVVQDAQQPPTPLAAPNRADGLVPDRHFLPNRAIASAGGAATGIAADAAALARWGYRLYGGQVLSPAGTTAMSTPVTDGYGLGTLIVDDGGPQALPDYRLGGIGAIGHPGLLVPGYQATLLVVPHNQISVSVLTVAPSEVGATEIPIIIADILDALHT